MYQHYDDHRSMPVGQTTQEPQSITVFLFARTKYNYTQGELELVNLDHAYFDLYALFL